ncbi:hypothetical protein fugu_017632 [Takifugu bimaculatus]|uniref:WxxW domain-containing protein n=1 Tax=Takifugu bimaculatus TaxID=433685 RepID=A0A4Z2BRL2_9TELE|nr:hypothetical protein fugu_017632 [Takifugu bimaculatus]
MIQLLSLVVLAGFVSAHDGQEHGIVDPKVCSYHDITRCWTSWFDVDNEFRSGDYETLSNIISRHPSKICRDPVDIEARTLSGLTPSEAGDNIYRNDVSVGFICRNEDQADGSCSNYRVRFSCYAPYCTETCWTSWFSRDDPTGTGDWELLNLLKSSYPGRICDSPRYIEAVTVDSLTSAAITGEIYDVFNPTEGFHCDNSKQSDGVCRDYKVRFGCPCVYGYSGVGVEPDREQNQQLD